MAYNEEDEIISTDMYLEQQNYNDVISVEDIEYHITLYDTPNRDSYVEYTRSPYNDNAHLVFNVPNLYPYCNIKDEQK
jgi:hypothetical protein